MVACAWRPKIRVEHFHLVEVLLARLMPYLETEPSDEFRQRRGDRLVDAVGTLTSAQDEQAARTRREIRPLPPELFPYRRSGDDRLRVQVASRLGVGGSDDVRHIREEPGCSAGKRILFLQHDRHAQCRGTEHK